MVSRRFELVVPDVTLQQMVRWALPYGRKHGGRDPWIRIREERRGPRLTARAGQMVIASYGGSYVANGTLRASLVPEGTGVRIVGRIRWGMLTYVVGLMALTTGVVLAMGIGYRNEVIGLFSLVPLAVGAVNAQVLLRRWRLDPPELAARLEDVLSGRAEAEEPKRLAALWRSLTGEEPPDVPGP